MTMQRRDLLLAGMGSALTAMAPGMAWAQSKAPLHIMVPYAAGGPIDLNVRRLGQHIPEALGSVVIENRPGAGGSVGLAALAKAAPDGRTIGIAAVATIAINPWLLEAVQYNPLEDFAAIAQLTRVPNVLVMNAERAKERNIISFESFLAYAKEHSADMSYASGGMGSAGHLAGEAFNRQAGLSCVHVPYNGAAPSQLALMSGEVDFSFDNMAAAAANIRAGKLIGLAVTSAERSAMLADLPAVAETFEGFVFDTWWGLVAPAGTPEEVLDELHAAVIAAQKTDDMEAFYKDMMMENVVASRQDFTELMRREYERYEGIVQLSGAKNI